MKNYELTVECKITYTIPTRANNEEEASQKVLKMLGKALNLWASDEDIEIIDIFEIEDC